MELDYVVVTSVDRDDLELQGADHFAACIREIKRLNPNTLVEVLIPDFRGRKDLLELVIEAKPDVIAHNVECVERLTPNVRDPKPDTNKVSMFSVSKPSRPVCIQNRIMVESVAHRRCWQPCLIYVL